MATSTYMQNINTDIIHVDNSQEKCREEEDTLDGILYYKYSDRIKKVTAGKNRSTSKFQLFLVMTGSLSDMSTIVLTLR